MNHNLRYYPMVQQMRRMREAGEFGEILVVQGTYSQDWMLYETDWNWRVDPKAAGASRVMADIGSHCVDMAEHITGCGSPPCARSADLPPDPQTAESGRREFREATSSETVDVEPIDTEDFGATIFRMGDARAAP